MPIQRIRPITNYNDIRRIARELPQAFDASLNEIGRNTKRDYGQVVSDWKHKPTFVIVRTKNTVAIKITGPNAKIWTWVDLGTRAHIIRAKRAKNLAFRGGYQPKTRKGNTKYKGPGVATGSFVTKKQVRHPGNAPRGFSLIIQRRQILEGRKIIRKNLSLRRIPV